MIATSRSQSGENSKELEELGAKETYLSVIQLSVNDPATFSTAVGVMDGIISHLDHPLTWIVIWIRPRCDPVLK